VIVEGVGKLKCIVQLDYGTHKELTSSQLITLPKDAVKAMAEDTTIPQLLQKEQQHKPPLLPVHHHCRRVVWWDKSRRAKRVV
jgi:hypothetical protein